MSSDRNTTYKSGGRKDQVLSALTLAGRAGITAPEFAELYDPRVTGVNSWTGVFTVLRQDGRISTLVEKRDGSRIHVLNGMVGDRETWPGYRHGGHCATCTCDEEK